MGTDFKGWNNGLIQDCSSFKGKTLETGKEEVIDDIEVKTPGSHGHERQTWKDFQSILSSVWD